MHVGCLAVAHEAAAAFGDDLAFNRAVSRTNLADPGDVVRTFLPTMTAGMPSAVAARTEAFVMTEGPAWGRQVDVGVCEVGRETARRLGLPDSTQQALYHAYESWVGGWAPDGLRGDADRHRLAGGARCSRSRGLRSARRRRGRPDRPSAAVRRHPRSLRRRCLRRGPARHPGRGRRRRPARPGPRGRARSGRRAHRGPARRGGRGVRRPRRHQGAVPPRSLEGGGRPGDRRRPPAGTDRRRGRSHRDRRPPARRRSRRCLQRGVGEAGAAQPRSSGSRCACTPTSPSGSWPRPARWRRSPPWPACTTSGWTGRGTTGARRPSPSRWRRASSPPPTPTPP